MGHIQDDRHCVFNPLCPFDLKPSVRPGSQEGARLGTVEVKAIFVISLDCGLENLILSYWTIIFDNLDVSINAQ